MSYDEEAEQQRKRVENMLEMTGVSIENLSTMGKNYIQVLSELADTLKLDNFDISSYVDAMQQVVKEHDEALDKQNDMDKITDVLREKTRVALLEKEKMDALREQVKQASAEREKKENTQQMVHKIKAFQMKQKRYQHEVDKIQSILQQRKVVETADTKRW